MKKYDVFISYRRSDGAQYARILQLVLENFGYEVFLDYNELKDGKFSCKIESAIKQAPIFLIVLTQKYLSRCWKVNDWVRKEISLAIQCDAKIIPVVPDGVVIKQPLFLDNGIKNAIFEEQFSNIYFGSSLIDDVKAMVNTRIADFVVNEETVLPEPYYFKIASFINDSRTMPIHYVDHDTSTGFVKSPFNLMMIGFTDFECDIFRYIYEFSTFIGDNKRRVPFHCYALDEMIDARMGSVRIEMPAITNSELELVQVGINSQEFWDLILKVVSELNYIVISIEDVNTAISIAKQIYKYRRQDNYTSSKLGIFVRCNEKACKVVNRLNELYNYTYVQLIPFMIDKQRQSEHQAKLSRKAMVFNWFYNNSDWTVDFGREAIERIMKEKRLNRYHAICELSRQTSQNISNSLHGPTKLILMGIEPEKHPERLELYMDYIKSRAKFSTNYTCGGDEAQLLLNMAIVEHERWIAAHRVMGYTHGKSKDAVHQYHPSICPWAELDEKTQSYDCDVVDTTIKLAYNKLIATQPNGVK